jgi:hypothetical protein
MRTDDGRLVVIAGASRSGKTAWTIRQVGKAARALAWDPEDQWAGLPGWRRVTSRDELLRLTLAAGRGPGRFAYVAGGDPDAIKKDFGFFAGVAMYWGRYLGPMVVVAEELADVTNQGKAPGSWGILLRRGLKRGISIYAISQRWAEADKTAMGNASEYVIFRMSSRDDVAYMARKTRVPVAELESLTPEYWDAERRYLRRGPFVRAVVTGEIERGAVTLPKPKG